MCALIEAWIAPLDRLLNEGASDLVIITALGAQCLERAANEFQGALWCWTTAVPIVRPGRLRRLRCRPPPPRRLLGPDEIVVVDELVAIADEEIRGRLLHA